MLDIQELSSQSEKFKTLLKRVKREAKCNDSQAYYVLVSALRDHFNKSDIDLGDGKLKLEQIFEEAQANLIYWGTSYLYRELGLSFNAERLEEVGMKDKLATLSLLLSD